MKVSVTIDNDAIAKVIASALDDNRGLRATLRDTIRAAMKSHVESVVADILDKAGFYEAAKAAVDFEMKDAVQRLVKDYEVYQLRLMVGKSGDEHMDAQGLLNDTTRICTG